MFTYMYTYNRRRKTGPISILFLVLFSALIYGIPFPSDVEGISFGAQWANHVMEVLTELSNMSLAVSIFYFGSALLGSKSKP